MCFDDVIDRVFLFAQDTTKKRLPIIDVHVYAFKVNPNAKEMCPWFLKDMPGADPNQTAPPFYNSDCADPLKPARTDQEMQDAVTGTMKRLNMTAIVSGEPELIRNWQKAAPGKIIPSFALSILNWKDPEIKAFRDSLSSGFYKVVGEVAPQYRGLSPSDTSPERVLCRCRTIEYSGIHSHGYGRKRRG